jgi:hypothetical protein
MIRILLPSKVPRGFFLRSSPCAHWPVVANSVALDGDSKHGMVPIEDDESLLRIAFVEDRRGQISSAQPFGTQIKGDAMVTQATPKGERELLLYNKFAFPPSRGYALQERVRQAAAATHGLWGLENG